MVCGDLFEVLIDIVVGGVIWLGLGVEKVSEK